MPMPKIPIIDPALIILRIAAITRLDTACAGYPRIQDNEGRIYKSLTTGWVADEWTHETPKHAKVRHKNKVRSVNEKYGPFPGFCLLQSRLDLFYFKLILLFGVPFGWHHANLAALHPHSLHELPHALRTALQPRQPFDHVHRLRRAGRRVFSKVCLQCGTVFIQVTARAIEWQRL